MSLYGALFASVAGLQSQSNKIGIISDNISNVNTVGYKRGDGQFETLVTNSGLVSAYSPGGVLSQNRSLVSQQGLIQGTSSTTDVAISGNGFFVVNTGTDSSGSILYTRSGSFTQDNLGNFINTGGFYLQGWPLDRDGQLPGAPGNPNTNSSNNLTSLQTVNVQQATGAAAATTAVEISANLQGSQKVFPGAEADAPMDRNTVNFGQPGKSIIVPGGADSIQRGDKFTVSTGTGLTYTYRYGGFTYGRSVLGAGNGDNNLDLQARQLNLPAAPVTVVSGNTTVTIHAPANGLANGDVVTISGVSGTIGGLASSVFNDKFVVSNVTGDTFDITIGSTPGSGGTGGGGAVIVQTRPFAGNILDAQTATQAFLGTTGTSGFLPTGLTFSINTQATGPVTFTYTSSTPNAQLRQFNNLNNLAEAINSVSGLTARVSGGRIYVGAVDANAAVTFTNGQSAGSSGPPVQAGIDWVRELGLKNITIGDDRFNSLTSLAAIINTSAGLDASVSNTLTNATLTINVEDPLDTVSFSDQLVPSTDTYATTTPFTTVANSNVVTINSPSPNGFKNGDLVTLDTSTFTGYTPVTLTNSGSIQTDGSTSTVRINYPGATTVPYTAGEWIYIDPTDLAGWPNGTFGGIPVTDFSGAFQVVAVNTTAPNNYFTIAVADASTSVATYTIGTAGTESFEVSQTFNGIPIQDFTGTFEVTVTGPSTFTVELPKRAAASGATGAANLEVTPPQNQGSLLAALGMVDSLAGSPFTVQTLGPIGPEYDPTDSAKNMAGGSITPQYSQNVQVYDSLGTGHNLKVSFIKTSVNTWAVELYATDPAEVSSTFANGLLAFGTLTFNGDGSLRSVSSGIANAINIPWTDGSLQGTVSFNWGTQGEPAGTVGATQIGGTDGMTQFDTAYKINSIDQNGAAVGQLTGVSIDNDGFVIANFNNGQSQKLYKIPIATFTNPDQLSAVTGNVYTQTNASGQPNLREPGTNGAGAIQSSALESSTVDLSTELTNLIVAQRGYQANTKIISTADDLLDSLNNIIR